MKTQGRKTTNPSTITSFKDHKRLDKLGNQGNTTFTTLPKGGCPVGTKKTKAGRKAYS